MPTYKDIDSYLSRTETEVLGEAGEYTNVDQYFRQATQTSTSTAGAVSSVANGANNRIATFASSKTLNGESALTFDGSKLNVQGGLIHKRRVITSSSSIVSNDYFIAVRATSAIVLTLPASTSLTNGQTFIIKDEGGNAETYNITIQASGEDTVDGQSSLKLISSNSAINLYTDAAGKYFIY